MLFGQQLKINQYPGRECHIGEGLVVRTLKCLNKTMRPSFQSTTARKFVKFVLQRKKLTIKITTKYINTNELLKLKGKNHQNINPENNSSVKLRFGCGMLLTLRCQVTTDNIAASCLGIVKNI